MTLDIQGTQEECEFFGKFLCSLLLNNPYVLRFAISDLFSIKDSESFFGFCVSILFDSIY